MTILGERAGKWLDNKLGFSLKRKITGPLKKAFPNALWAWETDYKEEFGNKYSGLDFKDRNVLDIGSDQGFTPHMFLRRGAKKVVGYSLEPLLPKFRDPRYEHHQIPFSGFSADESWVLKADCEGCEWSFTPEFLQQFHDFVIVMHHPIRNQPLIDWLEANAGKEEPRTVDRVFWHCQEFAIYRRKR